ncbi:MAG: glutathione S-transferase family protein [Formosimonas sp.]
MSLKLHYIVTSTYSAKALLAFYEKGIAFDKAPVDFSTPEKHAEFKKLYPMGKAPLLTGNDDIFVPESTTIVEYLEDNFPNQGPQLIPSDKTAARRTRLKDRMIDLYVNNNVGKLFFGTRKPEAEQDKAALEAAHKQIDEILPWLEKDLAGKSYLGGDNVSMADLALFAPLFYAKQLHPYSQHANLSAWLDRMMARPSVQTHLAELMPYLEAFNQKNA